MTTSARRSTVPSRPATHTLRTYTADLGAPTAGDPTFAGLGIEDDLVEVLAAAGITTPFPVQVMTIPDALEGRDICGKAKTGSGKTLAFGLPLIERLTTSRPRRPRGLVLVPTRELANQVAEELTPLAAARGLWLSAVYGGVSMNRQIEALRMGVDLVIATPGRLNDLLERGEVSLEDVEMVVLDEADQMADMGFLPQVERILHHVDRAQVMLFSATLDGDVGTLVERYQHDPTYHEVASDTTTVETLEQRFVGVTAPAKVEMTARIVSGARRALVFVRTTHGADRLAKQLGREGLQAAAIHGRLSQARRERTLAAFAGGVTPVLVATNVAARGLHVDGVELVVHFDPPEDHKVYLHRSGRTARAGESGLVVTLVLPEQEREVTAIERAAGIDLAIVPMPPDDPRLLSLGAWTPPTGLPEPERYDGHAARPVTVRRRGGQQGAPKAKPAPSRPRARASRPAAGNAPADALRRRRW